jgi:hypothetical protein
VPLPARTAVRTPIGYDVTLPAGTEAASGPVCLTFEQHGPKAAWNENQILLGSGYANGTSLSIAVDHALRTRTLARGRFKPLRSMQANAREWKPRLPLEARRRGQPVPLVNKPH